MYLQENRYFDLKCMIPAFKVIICFTSQQQFDYFSAEMAFQRFIDKNSYFPLVFKQTSSCAES